MGWVVALAVAALLAFLPVGISLSYGEEGFFAALLFGFIRFKLYPKERKSKKKNKVKNRNIKSSSKTSSTTAPVRRGGSLSDFMPFVEIAIDLLRTLRKKIRVNRLEMHLVMAGEDPCDLSVNYGKAWAAVSNLIPLLEQAFIIKKRDIQVSCDYLADITRITARLDLTLTVGRIIKLIIKYGIHSVCAFIKLKKAVH